MGSVTEVQAADDTVTGVSVSTEDNLSDVVWPWVLIALTALATVGLVGGLGYILRRRNEGFDQAFEAC